MDVFRNVFSPAWPRLCFITVALACAPLPALAQNASSAETLPTAPPPSEHNVVPRHEDKRAYGVLPNYRTAESELPFSPLTNRQKWMIGVKDSFDGASYPIAAFFSGIAQINNTNPSFGQGVKGYAHRYGTALTDQIAGNLVAESLLPVILHEDPRFFRKAHGSKMHRAVYAATRVFVCRNDNGNPVFNTPEVLGNAMVASLGNAYYPDSRGLSPTAQRMFTQIGTDAISNVLKEFWPDVKDHFARKKREKEDVKKDATAAGM